VEGNRRVPGRCVRSGIGTVLGDDQRDATDDHRKEDEDDDSVDDVHHPEDAPSRR
jgi:hypothetical protein